MWLSRPNLKLPHRARRPFLLVEHLENRELLNGSPLPSPPQEPVLNNQGPALPGRLAEPPANSLWPGQALPGGDSEPPVTNLPGRAWPGVPQRPAGLLPPGALPGPIQKSPANSKAPLVNIPLVVGPDQSSTPNGEGYTPAQMQQAYGFNKIILPAGKTFNDAGSGQTIAIIDGLNDPSIVSDLQTFDETFNIGGAAHNPTSTGFFKVVNQDGGSTLPPTDNGQIDYGLETSLDVEWAHAMAPGAKILLVEVNTPNDLNTAIEFAARQPGVSVISMSFGYSEWSTEYYLDNMFTTPAGHQGVSFVSSAGDRGGFFTQYQAMSPNVLSVGGTTLAAGPAGNPDRVSEYGWSDGGGGISEIEAEPAYQRSVQSTGSRTGPDLAYDADQTTGVAVYDTLYANAFSPDEPWLKVGGTSMGAPQVSSLVAIANQLRAAAREGTLDGPNQLLPAIYQIAATDPHAFQDITTGNNGYPAGPGYDLVTGLGTPNAQYLVPALVAAYRTPPAPATLYWTGDAGDNNWDTPGNWSTIDPVRANVQQAVLPTSNDQIVVDLRGATIRHDANNYDTISSFTVTAHGVTLDLGAGTLDLSGGGGRGTFQVDQAGDAVTMEAGVLRSAVVTSRTTLSATPPYSAYPELNDVEVDGTLNANQTGNNNGLTFQNGLILNGTINLGGSRDISSVLLAGYSDSITGVNQGNNPETITGSGTIQFGQSEFGDAIYNWGTLGTLTIGPGITVRGGGPGSAGYFEQTFFTGGLDNQGTFKANGGSLQISAFGPALDGWEPSSATGWTNEGTIEATGATLSLLGGWINNGTIRTHSASTTVYLGNPTDGLLPGGTNAAYYGWSSTDSLSISNGATVVVGGFLTSDQYQAASSIPGVAAGLAHDSLFLDGTLDNSAADNPVTGGVLAVTAKTGPLQLMGGTINGGTLKSSGSDGVQLLATTIPYGPLGFAPLTLSGGLLSNLTNNASVTVTGLTLKLSNVTNNSTVAGIGGATVKFLGTWDNANGTISIDPSSILYLGTPDPTPPRALAGSSAYAWYVRDVGTIDVANGATIYLGGLMTADLFTAFQTLPGVHIDLAQDTVALAGWLDDSPADNPETGGVLALTSATGAVDLAGGLIYQGTITSIGTGALNVEDIGGVASSGGGVLDGVTNDGTIAVLSTDFLNFEGAVINNGTVAASIGVTSFLPGGSFTNNGSLNLSNNLNNYVLFSCNSSMVNNGTILLDSAALEVLPYDRGSPAVTLTNTGTIVATDYSFIGLIGGLKNTGTISATNTRCYFEGNSDNATGTISVDSASLLFMGYSAGLDPDYPVPPTIADFSPYALNLSQVGTIDVADGGTFCLGGLVTTDQFHAFRSLPGVHINFARASVYFAGWLDNTPADNLVSHGILAITASTGPFFLDDGYIDQGKITTSGSNDLEAASNGFLGGVELDGNLNVSGPFGGGSITVLNNLTLKGTIEMPGVGGRISFGYFDDAPETIRGTGTIFLGESGTDDAQLLDLSRAGLTIDSGITIDAGATDIQFLAVESAILNTTLSTEP